MATKPKNDEEVAVDEDVLEGIEDETEEKVELEEEVVEEEIELSEKELAEIEFDEKEEKTSPKVEKKKSVSIAELAIKDLVVDSIDRKKEEFVKTDPKMVQLMENIRVRGLLNPIIVYELEEKPGKYRVIAGRRRTQAMRLLKKDTITAIVKNFKTEEDFVCDAISDNAAHSEADREKIASTIKALIDEGVCKTQVEVAKLLGFSQPWVSNLLAFGKLPQELKDEVSVSDARDVDDIEEKSPEEIKKEVQGKKFRPMPRDYFVDPKKPDEKIPVKVHVSSRLCKVTCEIPLVYFKEGNITKFLTEQIVRIHGDEGKFVLLIRKFRQQEFAVKKDGEVKKVSSKKKVEEAATAE